MQLVEGVFAGKVKALTFTSDGRRLAAAGDGTTIWLGEMEPQPGPVQDIDALRPHHFEQINALLAWRDQPILISGSDDTTVRFWDLKSKTLWGTFSSAARTPEPEAPDDPTPVRELDWVLYTPEGFFDSTSNGSKLVRFRQYDKAETLEQFEKTHYTFRLGEQLLNGQTPRLAKLAEPPPVSIVPPVRPDSAVPETELTVALVPRIWRMSVSTTTTARSPPAWNDRRSYPLSSRSALGCSRAPTGFTRWPAARGPSTAAPGRS